LNTGIVPWLDCKAITKETIILHRCCDIHVCKCRRTLWVWCSFYWNVLPQT